MNWKTGEPGNWGTREPASNYKNIFIGRIAFEKLTDYDFKGETYYTIRNLSLYECQGWCREEPECQAASFRYLSTKSKQ